MERRLSVLARAAGRITVALGAVIALVGMPALSCAFDYPAPSPIGSAFVAGPGNAHFRVTLASGAPLCSAGLTWAYVEAGDPGEKTKISALLTAYALGKPVGLITLEVTKNGSPACQIVEFGF